MSGGDFFEDEDGDVAVVKKTHTDFAKPALYALIMHNDDYTTMEFVVMVLVEVLSHDLETAVALMMTIHETGQAQVAVYPKEIAQMKLARIDELASQNEFPLLTTLERVDA